jgi:hypothetical protein
MIKSSLKQSKPCKSGLSIAILSESNPKQCWSSTNSSPSLASPRSSTFANSSSKGRSLGQTKPQGLVTMKINISPGRSTTSTPMDVEHRRAGRRVMGHPRIQHKTRPQTKDSINTTKGADQRVEAAVAGEARTQSDPALHVSRQ